MKNKISAIGMGVFVLLWAVLTLAAWFGPAQEYSVAERRKLAQKPELTVEALLANDELNKDGSIRKKLSYMTLFEDYSLDQFPLRDKFRQIKALFHYNVMGQMDNNDIYIAGGYAAKMLYPLNETMVKGNLSVFDYIHKNYLIKNGCKAYMAVVPDKSFYLASESGHLSMDYDKLWSMVEEGMPWAKHIDLRDTLDIHDYYYTDTHWRQECIVPAAQKISNAMGVTAPQESDFTRTALEKPFYGVYYGQAALPMEPEKLYLLESPLLQGCTVTDAETNTTGSVYNMDMVDSGDMYNVFLSGAKALLTVKNPNASTRRELIVFRDSFGSSITPLLVQDYSTVTVVDLRYIDYRLLEQYVTFRGKDVLFLYNTQVLNTTPLM